MKYAVIADVAGQYEALLRLEKKIPDDYEIIYLGDLVDRGPDSEKVIEHIRLKNRKSCYGNHEDMFINANTYPMISADSQLWMMNGGRATNESYKQHPELLKDHIEFLKTLPKIIRLPIQAGDFNELVLTHAPIHPTYADDVIDFTLEVDTKDMFRLEQSVIWSRRNPRRRNFLQISGHNSHWGYKEFKDEKGIFAYCLDQSQSAKLTAMLIPDMTLIEEDYEIN